MSVNVPLSPTKKIILNPHESILRRPRSRGGRRRLPMTITQHGRSQSIAAVTGDRSRLPPTPMKTNYVKRKTAHTGKRRNFRVDATPSPSKKRKLAIAKSAKSSRNVKKSGGVDPEFFHNLGMVGVGSFSQVFKVQNAFNKKVFALKKSTSYLHTRYIFLDFAFLI